MTPLVLLLLTATDPAASVLEPFRAAWNAQKLDAALAQVSDNATFTWVVDPATGPEKAMPDVAFTGHEPITAFLESHQRRPGKESTNQLPSDAVRVRTNRLHAAG